jgi:hypothetical protein
MNSFRAHGALLPGVAPRHLHDAQLLAVELQRGELAAPDRAGVDAVADEQAG